MVKELQYTLQRHIGHCTFRPGLLMDIMDSLAVKVIVTNLSILQHYVSSGILNICLSFLYSYWHAS